jgi:hypothetical protein
VYGLTNVAVSGATADPDGDGLANLFEYGLGTHPNLFNFEVTDGIWNGLPAMNVEGSDLTLTFIRDAGRSNITSFVESSTNLTDWAEVVSGITETSLGDGGRERVKTAVPMTPDAKRFLRVKVREN